MSKNPEQVVTLEQEERLFSALLTELAKSDGKKRSALVRLFRMALNALHGRAEVDRLNALSDAVKGMAEASAIRKAITRFSGGIVRLDNGSYADKAEASIVMYVHKAGMYVLIGNKQARAEASAMYDTIRDIDFDCLDIKNPKNPLDSKAELVRLGKRINKLSIKSDLDRKFLSLLEAEGLIEL